MHKELIICSIIIALVIIFNILTQNYTQKTVETINNKLTNFKEILIQDDIDQNNAKEKCYDILNTWKEKYETLAYYIEHDELEKVETELTALSSSIDVEEYDDGIENLDRCMFILNHIKSKYIMELKNIF